MRVFWVMAMVMLLASCATSTGADLPVSERPQVEATEAYMPANAEICGRAGGDYIRDGMLGWYQCVYRYADGGQVCSDSSECEGDCRATTPMGEAPPEGYSTGTCQLTTSPFGCYGTVENGRVGPFLCVD